MTTEGGPLAQTLLAPPRVNERAGGVSEGHPSGPRPPGPPSPSLPPGKGTFCSHFLPAQHSFSSARADSWRKTENEVQENESLPPNSHPTEGRPVHTHHARPRSSLVFLPASCLGQSIPVSHAAGSRPAPLLTSTPTATGSPAFLLPLLVSTVPTSSAQTRTPSSWQPSDASGPAKWPESVNTSQGLSGGDQLCTSAAL